MSMTLLSFASFMSLMRHIINFLKDLLPDSGKGNMNMIHDFSESKKKKPPINKKLIKAAFHPVDISKGIVPIAILQIA